MTNGQLLTVSLGLGIGHGKREDLHRGWKIPHGVFALVHASWRLDKCVSYR
jgi:hypothetical protein